MSTSKFVVMMAFSNPDTSRRLRNLAREEAGIRAALQPLVTAGRLDRPVTIPNASIDAIAAALEAPDLQRRVRVFHYGGHADDETLMLTGEKGAPAQGHARGLADFLGAQEGLELVVLNGCSTKAHIERLHEVGVKAVVATSRAIMDDVAADFAAKLYAGLVNKPLTAAFAAAEALLRGKRGENPRAFQHDDPVVARGWSSEWPWVLSWKTKEEEWMLMNEKVSEKVLIGELARVLNDQSMGGVVLARIGFPRERIPRTSTALEFWSIAVDAVRSGAVPAKEQALIDEVAEMYPGNEFFNRLSSKP